MWIGSGVLSNRNKCDVKFEEPRLGTKTLTVVFTDLANYTASVGRSDRETLRNLVASHEQAVAPVLEKHGGRVIKNLGDSYMAVFLSASDGIRACLDLQDAMSGPAGFSIRAAMATGDVEEISNDAFGEAVNLAARILSKTPAGEVWFSPATHLCMNQAETAWEPGRILHRLKGISGEIQVYRGVPNCRTWLPERLLGAARRSALIRVAPDSPRPRVMPDSIVLLEGYSPADAMSIDWLVSIEPAKVYLAAYRVAPSDRRAWTKSGRHFVIGRPDSIDAAITEAMVPVQPVAGSDTIILDGGPDDELELVLSGLALPMVPLSDVVDGYSYELSRTGEWVAGGDNCVVRVQVGVSGVRVTALAPGVMVPGKAMAVGGSVKLDDGDEIHWPSMKCPVRYIAIGANSYVGILVGDSPVRLGIGSGQTIEIGREPAAPGLILPDRRGVGNISWCAGNRAARAKQSGFTLDRALAGRKQGAVSVGPDGASVMGLHERCPTYIVDGKSLSHVVSPRRLDVGTLIVTGTSVISLTGDIL